MKRIILVIIAIIFSSFQVSAADLSNISASSDDTINSNKRAVIAADANASALFPKNTAEHLAYFKKELNSIMSSTKPIPSIDRSVGVQMPTKKSKSMSAKTTGLDTTLGKGQGYEGLAEVKISSLDRDPRYITNTNNHLTPAILNDQMVIGGTKVIGGEATNNYMNTVIIIGNSQLCTGTIIAKNAVLTAQHCICDGIKEYVIVGENLDDKQHRFPVAEIILRKECGSSVSDEADVALLIMQTDFKVTIETAKIASKRLLDEAKIVRVVGFGKNEKGKYGEKSFVDIPVVSLSCAGAVLGEDGRNIPDWKYYGCNRNFEFVAGGPLLDKDACIGDSGGPAFIKDFLNNDYLAGVISRNIKTPGTRECGDGCIYVRVDDNVIDSIIKHGVRIAVGGK